MGKLKTEVLNGVFYTAIAKYSGIIVSLIITAILARLLKPEDFGVVVIASIFINFFSILTTVGLGPAIVQNRELDKTDLISINTFAFLLAFLLTFLFIILTPLLVSFWDNDELLKRLFYLLSINIFFSIASIVPNAIIMKEKKFKFIAIRTLVVQVVTGIISIIAVLFGFGIYSLILSPILSSIILLIINFTYRPVYLSLKIQKKSIQKIFSFSLYQMLFNFIYLLYRNIDKILIGKYFGMSSLGYYEKSYRLMMLPLENVSGVISPVLHPVLSEYQNNKDYLWHTYIQLLKLFSEIGLLLTVVIYFSSRCLIILFFGHQWESAVPIFQILSLSIGFQLMQAPIGAIFQSLNKTKALFFCSFFVLLFVCIAIFWGVYQNTLEYLTSALVLAFLIGFLTYQYFIVKCFGKKMLDIFKVICEPLICSLVLFVFLKYFFTLVCFQNIFFQLLLVGCLTIAFIFILFTFGRFTVLKQLFLSIINKLRIFK